MGGSTIAIRSQPVPCGDCNSNDITSSTSIETMRSANGSAIVDGVVLVGG